MVGSGRKMISRASLGAGAGTVASTEALAALPVAANAVPSIQPCMQYFAPAGFKVALDGGLRGFADCFVSAEAGLVEQGLEDVVRGFAAVKRIDQRLHDGDRAVIGAGVGPGLKEVGRGNVPVGDLSGFVDVRTEMGDRLRFVERSGKLEIGGRGVDGVGVEDDEPIHLAGVEIGDERLDARKLIGGHRAGCLARNQSRLADVAQSCVNGKGEFGDGRILIDAGDDDALAGVGLEVFGEGGEELFLLIGPGVGRSDHAGDADGFGQLGGEGGNLAGAEAEAMLGFEAGGGRGGFDGVEAIELFRVLAPVRILADQRMKAGEAGAR